MTKKLILCILLITVSFCLKTSHRQTPPSQLNFTQEQTQAYGRMIKFVQSDQGLSTALKNQADLDSEQLRKLSGFMIDDKYFQNQLIEAVASDPQNQWISTLSKKAQIRYLRIVTSVPFDRMQDPKVMSKVVNRLVKDKEIGPALYNKYGEGLSQGDFIKKLQTQLGSQVNSEHKHHLHTLIQ